MTPSPQPNNNNNTRQAGVPTPPSNNTPQIVPLISRNQTPQQIGTDVYLKHLLVVINGFLLGILRKDQKFYDIHNKEEAKRLLSVFHNDYKKQQKTFSATTNNELRDLYDNAMKTLLNLEAIDRYKVEMRLAQSDAKKQQIRKNIIRLQQLIPQAYKNDSIPIAGGGFTMGSFINNLWAPSQQQQQLQTQPPQPPQPKPGQQGQPPRKMLPLGIRKKVNVLAQTLNAAQLQKQIGNLTKKIKQQQQKLKQTVNQQDISNLKQEIQKLTKQLNQKTQKRKQNLDKALQQAQKATAKEKQQEQRETKALQGVASLFQKTQQQQ
jgi:hypothetical protein